MSNNFLRYIFIPIFIMISFCSKAAGPDSTEAATEINFRAEKVLKKGIMLSELHLPGFEGKKDVHLKYSKAMRFDANYSPSGLKPLDLPVDTVKKYVDHAKKIYKQVKESKAFTTMLNGKDIKLPIGIRKQVGNKEVIICLDSIIFTPTYAYGVLYAIVEDTKNADTLSFWARDVRFTKDGGFTGDVRLELLETYDLKFGKNINVSFLVDRTHDNYLTFDCDGFKKLHIDARVFFSRDLFLPEAIDGSVRPSGQVTADFMTDMESLDNWIVQIANVPRFQVVGMEGVSFELNNIAFDYSSYENPSGIQFPVGYTSTGLTSGDGYLWEGFYIDGLIVTLPPEFQVKASKERISLRLNHAIIDKLGFSGKISVQNIFPLSQGEMGKWNYSLDAMGIEIVKNTVVAAQFSGNIVMPITKEDETFRYYASIQPNHNYNFTLATESDLHFPLWGGSNVDIYQDSWVSISLIDKKFVPKASLTGKFNLTSSVNGKEGDTNTSDKNSNLSLAEISFIKLIIQAERPIISLDPNGGAVSFGSPGLEQKMSNLPVSITEIGLNVRDNGNQMGIRFTILVNLVGEKDSGGGFSGSATITVWAKENIDKWKYYKTELNRIELNNIKIAVLTLSGFIEFYRDDPAYGSGFTGGIDLKIDCGAGFGLTAVCIFGKKSITPGSSEIYRYWAVDVLASIPALPLFPGIIYLNAFGGGASYRMRMDNSIQNAKFVSNSKVAYVPDNLKGLGLKALIGIQGQTRKAYEGQLIFEIEFNAGGGLSQIAFSGYVQIASLGNFDQLAKLSSSMGGFVSKVKSSGGTMDGPPASDSEVYGEIQKMGDGGALLAQWRMVYDRNNSSFTANLDLFVEVVGVIKGVNPNAHAGRIDILFTKKEWHVFVGLPNYPVGVTLVNIFNITSYFMVGHNLPLPNKMPVPGAPYPSFPSNAAGEASLGKGFGTGVRLHIGMEKTGNFYYRAGLDAGFDILIWNVAGQTCFGKPKGIKGWYGMGQAFVYVYGSAGLETCANVPYPCNWHWGCCFRFWRRTICPCLKFNWCQNKVCVKVAASIDLGLSAYVEAANPTYFEGKFYILGFEVGVKGGKRC